MHKSRPGAWRLIFFLVALFLIPVTSYSDDRFTDNLPGSCKSMHFEQVGALDQVVSRGTFQVHYATRGSQRLGNVHDLNRNGVPDVIDDLVLQLQAAERLYSDVLGLVHPLRQPRYAHANHIN